MASSPDAAAYASDHHRRAEPATEQQIGATERSGEDGVRDPALEVAADRRGADERGGHRQHEAEHEGDEDQHLRDPDLDLDRLGALRGGQRDEAVQAPADERDRDHREDGQDPDHPPSDEFLDGHAGDDDHVPASSGSPSSSMKRASSEPRPGSTAWTRPPVATRAATRSGMRSAASGRTDSQSPSRVTGPNDGGGRPARVAQVGHAQAHAVRRDDLVERSRCDDPAVVEDDHAIADTLDLGQQVRVEDDRRAAVASRAHDRPHVRPTDRIERRRRLVEEDQVRVAKECDAEPEPLLHPLRERADRVVGSIDQSDEGERLVDCRGPPAGRDAGELGVKTQHLAGMEPRLVAELLGQVADRGARPTVTQRRAEDLPGSRTRTHEAEEQLDGRGLAGAVRTEQTEQLAAPDGQAQIPRGRASAHTTWRRSRGRSRALTR